jgi:hypothetical protein
MKSNGMMRPGILRNGVSVEYKNLRELRRDMKNQLAQSGDGEIHVARSRRGEWGEWFEVWGLWAGKPRLLREGWQ